MMSNAKWQSGIDGQQSGAKAGSTLLFQWAAATVVHQPALEQSICDGEEDREPSSSSTGGRITAGYQLRCPSPSRPSVDCSCGCDMELRIC
jgi:hypothetical protein